MTKGSWLKIHRKILKSSVASADDLLGLFIRLLAAANFEKAYFKHSQLSEVIEVKPGQLIFGWRTLGKRLYRCKDRPRPSINTLRRRIESLERLDVLTVHAHESKHFSIITIRNWGTYQGRSAVSKVDTPVNTPTDTPVNTPTDTDRRRIKNVKNIKNTERVLSFEEWYATYPRKVARKAAERAYAKAIQEISKSEGIDLPKAASLLFEWTRELVPALQASEERFRPYPATWLNSGRYRDAIASQPCSQSAAQTQPQTKLGGYIRKPKPGRARA